MGSVIQLLTPSPEYTDEHNAWLRTLPYTIRELLFTVKRYYRPEWGDNWREHFAVDRVNGVLGPRAEVRQSEAGELLPARRLRPGRLLAHLQTAARFSSRRQSAGRGRHHGFGGAAAREPERPRLRNSPNPSVKLVLNCETLLFQRPDDAIHRGADKQAEADIASPGTFLSNYEPFTVEQAAKIVGHVAEFDKYTEPDEAVCSKTSSRDASTSYVVSSAHPRMVDGKPSKNPRYLQKRPDLENPRETYLAEIAARLEREIPAGKPGPFPGERGARRAPQQSARSRNRPAAAGRLQPDSLSGTARAVHGVHFQPHRQIAVDDRIRQRGRAHQSAVQRAVAGGGSEQRAGVRDSDRLRGIHDFGRLRRPARARGSRHQHAGAGDLVPHARPRARSAVHDRGRTSRARGGFRVRRADRFSPAAWATASPRCLSTASWAGFSKRPTSVFTEEMLRPEKQGLELFAAGVDAIVEAQRRVALNYFEDGSVEAACPPLKALLHIMAHGDYEGMGLSDPRFRELFDREAVLASDWYQERLRVQAGARHRAVAASCRGPGAISGFRRDGGFSSLISTSRSAREARGANSPASARPLISTNCAARSAPIPSPARSRINPS